MIICCLANGCAAQKLDNDFISKKEYEVINNVIMDKDGSKSYVYDTTYFDKDMAIFFEDENFHLITGNVGIPVTISDEDLKKVLNRGVRAKVRSKIFLSKPLALDPKKLNNNIVLSNSFDEPTDLSHHVKRITEPIIVDDIAVFRMVGNLESAVYILKKEKTKWIVHYTFNTWLILE